MNELTISEIISVFWHSTKFMIGLYLEAWKVIGMAIGSFLLIALIIYYIDRLFIGEKI